jgi:transposase
VRVMYERVAGIDVHKDMIKVAIRFPGEKGTRKTEVLEFRTFWGVLQEVARELRRRGVTHVAMEASGVYTEPVYHALCEQDFTEVLVINPKHVKALKGHKTDARDCRRIAELLECGLLRGSYVPSAEQKEMRDLTRYRKKLVQARTSEIQRMQKALESAPLTELAGLIAVSCMRVWTWVATVRAHGHRWGWGAGSAVAGGFPIWCG